MRPRSFGIIADSLENFIQKDKEVVFEYKSELLLSEISRISISVSSNLIDTSDLLADDLSFKKKYAPKKKYYFKVKLLKIRKPIIKKRGKINVKC